MNDPLGLWMTDNAELFRYIGELPSIMEKPERIMLSGRASLFLSSLLHILYPDAGITGWDSSKAAMEDALREYPSLIAREADFGSFEEHGIDIAVSLFAVNQLEGRAAVSYLMSLHSAMRDGGILYLAFLSQKGLVYHQGREEDSWYSLSEKVMMKRYAAEDMIRALDMTGFRIRAVECDEHPDIGDVITIICSRVGD